MPVRHRYRKKIAVPSIEGLAHPQNGKCRDKGKCMMDQAVRIRETSSLKEAKTCLSRLGSIREKGRYEDEWILRLVSALTPQQRAVFKLVVEGRLNKQIAYELGISLSTVKAHVSAVLAKLRVVSRTQAVILAKRLYIFP
jgi:DNA-binding NarL/FixJ family response regulator